MQDEMELIQEENNFFFDDFFIAPDDKGVPIEIEAKGRKVTIHAKRGVNLGDMQYAERQALKVTKKLDGTVLKAWMDEDIYCVELLTRCIASWPFEFRGTEVLTDEKGHTFTPPSGPVPITREYVKMLIGPISFRLLQEILDLAGVAKTQLDFFGNK